MFIVLLTCLSVLVSLSVLGSLSVLVNLSVLVSLFVFRACLFFFHKLSVFAFEHDAWIFVKHGQVMC